MPKTNTKPTVPALEYLFHPRAIAIVGVSKIRNMKKAGKAQQTPPPPEPAPVQPVQETYQAPTETVDQGETQTYDAAPEPENQEYTPPPPPPSQWQGEQ